MAEPHGNRGPEAVHPLDGAAADRAGQAFAAAVRNEWDLTWRLLQGLTPDELETTASVAKRLGRRASHRAHGALIEAALTAVRAGRAPRPSIEPDSWDAALAVARQDGGSLREPCAPAPLFGRPPLAVVPPVKSETHE